jgi:hypothetical protein
MKCPKCGTDMEDKNCPKCGYREEEKNEDIVKGIIGALIGSLAGVVAIVLLDLVGFVASAAGVIMGVCTITLYEKFAGSISKKGIVVCAVVMVIMTLVAENLAFAIAIYKALKQIGIDTSIWRVFTHLYSLMSGGYIEVGNYVLNLVLVYVFTALGAYSVIKKKLNLLK